MTKWVMPVRLIPMNWFAPIPSEMPPTTSQKEVSVLNVKVLSYEGFIKHSKWLELQKFKIYAFLLKPVLASKPAGKHGTECGHPVVKTRP